MPIVTGFVFLTPDPNNPGGSVVRTFPDPLIANIMTDENNLDVVTSVDQVFWQYTTQPPTDSGASPFPGAPEPDQVSLEIRFAPENTPFQDSSFAAAPVDPDNAAFSNIGSIEIAANEPRLDAADPPAGGTEHEEPENGFIFRVRDYEYAVVLTAQQTIELDPTLKIRRRHRRLE